jgi:hypothetical protein
MVNFLYFRSCKVNNLRKNVRNGDYHCLNDGDNDNDDDDDILNFSVKKGGKEVHVDMEHSSTVDSHSDNKKQCKEGDVLHI